MKRFLSFIIVCMMSVRIVLPVLCYTFDCDYIIKTLCENRNNPNKKDCHGKCYLKKELTKTGKEPNKGGSKVEVTPLEVFLDTQSIDFQGLMAIHHSQEIQAEQYEALYSLDFYSKIFRPPAV